MTPAWWAFSPLDWAMHLLADRGRHDKAAVREARCGHPLPDVAAACPPPPWRQCDDCFVIFRAELVVT